LIRRHELLTAGLSCSGISDRVKRGALHRRHRAVYSIGHRALSREAEMLAGVFAAGDGAALSHEAVAELRGLIRYRAPVIAVVSPRRRSIAGVRVHYCRRLHPLDIVVYHGIPVTTVARMLVDLSDIFTVDELVNVIHEAAYRNQFNLEATRRAMARANGRPSLHVLEEAIELYLNGSAGLKSRKEKAFLALVASAGFTKPLVNTKVEGIEVDFHWPDRRRIVEVDGRGHRRPTAKRTDPRRDAALRKAGWTVLRITHEEVEQRPERVLEQLKRYLSDP
jgi:very-short-patch-repair endonuclease